MTDDLLLDTTGDHLLAEDGVLLALESGNPVTTVQDMDLVGTLNRLAGTSGLGASGAANVWAGTSGLELVGALNVKNNSRGLEFNGVCRALAVANGGDGTLDAQGALASIP